MSMGFGGQRAVAFPWSDKPSLVLGVPSSCRKKLGAKGGTEEKPSKGPAGGWVSLPAPWFLFTCASQLRMETWVISAGQ